MNKNPFPPARAALLACALASSGCQLASAKRDRLRAELTQHSQALTTAVVDALELQPSRDAHSLLALELAREDQRVEGLPAHPIAVPELLAATNSSARDGLSDRFARIRQLVGRQERLDQRLIEQGALREAERRATLLRRARWLGGASILLGGGIALCIFFPACIPIFAWLAGKLPALASALGVVSLKAFDAVVRGVEKARASSTRLHNGPESDLPSLDSHLSREMDASHKALVRARKAALKL